jgi:hypothetical protein
MCFLDILCTGERLPLNFSTYHNLQEAELVIMDDARAEDTFVGDDLVPRLSEAGNIDSRRQSVCWLRNIGSRILHELACVLTRQLSSGEPWSIAR